MSARFMNHISGYSGSQTYLMRFFLLIVTFFGMICLLNVDAYAAGTPAGTTINNVATVTYNDAVGTYTRNSTISAFVVDDKVTFTLTSADAATVTVTPSGRAYMTYIIANNGNAPHDFTLTSAVTGSPTLTPSSGPLFYADAAGTVPLPVDQASGLPYISSLAPDASIPVYLFITAPADVSDGQSVNYLVTAEAWQSTTLGVTAPLPAKSSTQAATDLTMNKSTSPMNTCVVLADASGNGGDTSRDGLYTAVAQDGSGNTIGFRVQSATLNISKSVTVTDPRGTTLPVPGATLHYRLSITAAGGGTALGTVISDQVPANTTYVAGTLRLNGTLLTEAADSDAGDVDATIPGSLTVTLGDLTAVSPAQIITFDVRIN